jgi:hypothetical protein
MGKNLAKGENPAQASEQNGNDPDVLSSQPLEWYLEESTHSSRYFIGSYVLDSSMKVVMKFVLISVQQSPLSSRPKFSRHFSNRKKLGLPKSQFSVGFYKQIIS